MAGRPSGRAPVRCTAAAWPCSHMPAGDRSRDSRSPADRSPGARRPGGSAPSPTTPGTRPDCWPARCSRTSKRCSPMKACRCSPRSAAELSMDCSVPGPRGALQAHRSRVYLLDEAFDDDLFTILAWRGRERDDLLANVGAARTAEPPLPRRPHLWRPAWTRSSPCRAPSRPAARRPPPAPRCSTSPHPPEPSAGEH